MAGVLFVPTGFTFFWMTVFGNTAISKVLEGKAPQLVDAVENNVPVALFRFFEFFPFSGFLSILGLCLVITFFVSSSDSGSLVIDTLASGGAAEPPVWQRIYWAVLEGVVASTLLLAGGLEALQAMTIASAFPMIFFIMIGLFCFVKSLKEDYLLLSSVQTHSSPVYWNQGSQDWKQSLDKLVNYPKRDAGLRFIKEVVHPAFAELHAELERRGYEVGLETENKESARLVVKNEQVENFSYGVRLIPYIFPNYIPEEREKYVRMEVFLLQGGQNYCVYGYTKEQLIADAVGQYENHLHYLHISNSEPPE